MVGAVSSFAVDTMNSTGFIKSAVCSVNVAVLPSAPIVPLLLTASILLGIWICSVAVSMASRSIFFWL